MTQAIKIGNELFIDNKKVNLELYNIPLDFSETREPIIKAPKTPLEYEQLREYFSGLFVRGGLMELKGKPHTGAFDCIKIVDNRVIEVFSVNYSFIDELFYLLSPDVEDFKDYWLNENHTDFYTNINYSNIKVVLTNEELLDFIKIE